MAKTKKPLPLIFSGEKIYLGETDITACDSEISIAQKDGISLLTVTIPVIISGCSPETANLPE